MSRTLESPRLAAPGAQRRRPFLLAIVVAFGTALGGLSACKQAESSPSAAPAAAPPEDGVVVFAAASLRDSFTALGKDFEKAHAGATVTFNFAGTQELRTQ